MESDAASPTLHLLSLTNLASFCRPLGDLEMGAQLQLWIVMPKPRVQVNDKVQQILSPRELGLNEQVLH
jgi:hypothetical protein